MQIQVTTGADQTAVSLVCNFRAGDGAKAVAGRFASRVTLTSGIAEGYAFVSMPVRAFPADEKLPAAKVALTTAGPSGTIPPRTRASVSFKAGNVTTTLINGLLVKYSHN